MAPRPNVSAPPGPERRFQGFVSLAHTLCDLGRPGEAEEMCRWVLAQQPQLTAARVAHGRALLEGNRPADAILALGRAVRELPGSFAAHQWLTEALLDHGDLAGARVALAQAAVLSPESPRIAWLSREVARRGGAAPPLRAGRGRGPAPARGPASCHCPAPAHGPAARPAPLPAAVPLPLRTTAPSAAVGPGEGPVRATGEYPALEAPGAVPQPRDHYGPDDVTPVTAPLPPADRGPTVGRRGRSGALTVFGLLMVLGLVGGALTALHRDRIAAPARPGTSNGLKPPRLQGPVVPDPERPRGMSADGERGPSS